MLAGAGKGALVGGGIGLVGGAGVAAYQNRARGGPVNAGSPYMIGEEGPEYFVPMTSGHIIPHMANGTVDALVDNSDVVSGQKVTNSKLDDVVYWMKKNYNATDNLAAQ